VAWLCGTITDMPRLRDVPIAIRKAGVMELARRVNGQIIEDDVLVWASSMAYSWLFSVFPLLIFLLALLPYAPAEQRQTVITSINDSVKQLPANTAKELQAWVNYALNEKKGGLMSVGLLIALWAASGGMSVTMSAIDRCYDIDTGSSFIRHRVRAIVLTLVTAVLMILVVILLPVGGAVLQWLWYNSERVLGWQIPTKWWVLLDISRWSLGLLLLMMVLNVVYHFGCQVKRRYRFLTPGAVFCVMTWVALGLGFRLYIDRFAIGGYNRTYGAVGSVIILLFLFYLAAIVLLVGAEINSEIDYAVLTVPRGTKDFRKLDIRHDHDLAEESE
jgi:membrane protein